MSGQGGTTRTGVQVKQLMSLLYTSSSQKIKKASLKINEFKSLLELEKKGSFFSLATLQLLLESGWVVILLLFLSEQHKNHFRVEAAS